jgi:hypothetical protein
MKLWGHVWSFRGPGVFVDAVPLCVRCCGCFGASLLCWFCWVGRAGGVPFFPRPLGPGAAGGPGIWAWRGPHSRPSYGAQAALPKVAGARRGGGAKGGGKEQRVVLVGLVAAFPFACGNVCRGKKKKAESSAAKRQGMGVWWAASLYHRSWPLLARFLFHECCITSP